MSQSLNLVTAPDSYSPSATIEGINIDRVRLDVINNAIYWQLQKGKGGSGVWESTETAMTPGSRVIQEPDITGIRVRARTRAAALGTSPQAVVTVNAVY